MDSWLTYSDFKEKYPDSSLTEPQFTPMAIDAALFVPQLGRRVGVRESHARRIVPRSTAPVPESRVMPGPQAITTTAPMD